MRPGLVGIVLLAAFGTTLAGARDDFQREGEGDQRALKDELENKAPPALQVKSWLNTDNKDLKLGDLKGKVVVLDFWGTWCPPCRAAMPHLKELYKEHKDDGLVIIGVHTTNGADEMEAFVKKEKLPWPVAADVDEKTVKAFRVDSFPDYYLIDRAGKLRVADLSNADLDRAVKALLKEKAGR
jgi:cytochrome c biogenesis protein CcmG/thiol:disulfide interchange protein DsbE